MSLVRLPWLGGLGGDLLQPPAGLLQLGQGVGRGQGRHGRVLDEGLGRLVAAQVAAAAAAAPGVRLGRGRAAEGFLGALVAAGGGRGGSSATSPPT